MDSVASVVSAAASRPLAQTGGGARGLSPGLSAGLTVQARVTKVDDGMVQLRMGDQTVSVPSRVPLTVGQQVNILVEESSTGKLVLRITDDGAGKNRAGRGESGGGRVTGGTSGAGGTTAPMGGGRQLPVIGVQGRGEREPGGQPSGGQGSGGQANGGPANGNQASGATLPGGEAEWGGPDGWVGQTTAQARGAAIGLPDFAGRPGAGSGVPGAGTSADGTEGNLPGSSARADAGAGTLGSANASRNAPSYGATFGNPIGPRVAGQAAPGTSAPGWAGPASAPGQASRPGAAGPAGLPNAANPGSGTAAAAGWSAQATATGQVPVAPWTPGQPFPGRPAPPADPLASVLFEALDGTAARLAGTSKQRMSAPLTSGAPRGSVSSNGSAETSASTRSVPGQTPAGREALARTALPAYGRLAQSVGGNVAFRQLMAALPQDVVETLARSPLAPADVGRLLVDVGVHPDDMNTVLVGEMLSQGVPVQEKGVRVLRREVAAAGGSTRDAAPAVALSRLGLPITPLSLAVARQLLAGQLDPPSVWGELLPELQSLADLAGQDSKAGRLAADLLREWEVPFDKSPEAMGQWLRASVERVGTPLEAKLLRALAPPADGEPHSAPAASEAADGPESAGPRPGTLFESRGQDGRPSAGLPGQDPASRLDLFANIARGQLDLLGQDARARLDQLIQALPPSDRRDHDTLGQALQRTQATLQAEQFLNGSKVEQTEPRFFAVTLPTVMHHQASTLQIRVRERDAQPRVPGTAASPDNVQLKLSLPGLGDLGVNLSIGQQSVACHFAACSPFAEALLTAGAGDLVSRLKQLGYTQTSVDAAHEPPEAPQSLLAAAPRLNRVDLNA